MQVVPAYSSKEPLALVCNKAEVREETAKAVVVALVVVLFPVIRRLLFMVEEAVERKPLRKPRVVEVETPHEVGVHEKVPEPPVGQVVRQVSEFRQRESAESWVVEA